MPWTTKIAMQPFDRPRARPKQIRSSYRFGTVPAVQLRPRTQGTCQPSRVVVLQEAHWLNAVLAIFFWAQHWWLHPADTRKPFLILTSDHFLTESNMKPTAPSAGGERPAVRRPRGVLRHVARRRGAARRRASRPRRSWGDHHTLCASIHDARDAATGVHRREIEE